MLSDDLLERAIADGLRELDLSSGGGQELSSAALRKILMTLKGPLRITGAIINDERLDLQGVEVKYPVYLFGCQFRTLILQDSTFNTLALDGCHCENVEAKRLKVNGTLYARARMVPHKNHEKGITPSPFRCENLFDLEGANIENELVLSGAHIGNGRSEALSIQNAHIRGNVILDDQFVSHGRINLSYALVERGVWIEDAEITKCQSSQRGDLAESCIHAVGLKATARLTLRRSKLHGMVNLEHAKTDIFNDEDSVWESSATTANIRNFQYRCLPDDKDAYAQKRVAWILKIVNEYDPQPFDHLASVLKSMGHEDISRDVIAERDKRYGDAIKKSPITLHWLGKLIVYLVFRNQLIHKPYIVFLSILLSLAVGAFVFELSQSNMAPSKEYVYLHDNYGKADCGNLKLGSADCIKKYTPFSPYWFAIDALLPFVDFHQETNWAPTDPWLHNFYRLYIGLGWYLSYLALAAFSGLVKRL